MTQYDKTNVMMETKYFCDYRNYSFASKIIGT